MKVLLYENLPHELRHLLTGHDVFTVSYMEWAGTKNGALLKKAGAANLDVLITMDNGVAYQQNSATLPIAIVVIDAKSNDIDDLRPRVPALLATLRMLPPKTVVKVP